MNWFTRLFRRKKGSPRLAVVMNEAEGGDQVVVNGEDVSLIKGPGNDIIGRQRGQKRNRVHIYRQPSGYPIRLCDWIMVEKTDIEEVGECQGINGPADDIRVLAAALNWRENAGDRICRHCKATAQGKRTSFGMEYHGHGKGAA